MQVDNAQSVLDSAGQYEIAVYSFVYSVNNTAIAQRGIQAPKGLTTWGMSGCYGVAVFGGQANNAQVDFLAMFHSSGGLGLDRLNEFLTHLERQLPQPGGNFQWVLVISQGNEQGQNYNWTALATDAPNCQLFNTLPAQVNMMNGPAPGGSHNAFAVDFGGHWGALGGNIVNAPQWAVAPRNNGSVSVAHPRGQRGCCYISSACCQYLGLPDNCDVLETLRKYRDNVLILTDEGKRDIEAYYQQAPTIVRRLESLANCEQVYSVIYRNYLVPAVQLIQAGKNDEAHCIYRTLVSDLTRYLDMSECPDWMDATLAFGDDLARATHNGFTLPIGLMST